MAKSGEECLGKERKKEEESHGKRLKGCEGN
jgi:hypothetical protein